MENWAINCYGEIIGKCGLILFQLVASAVSVKDRA